jgi:hypothetical protein
MSDNRMDNFPQRELGKMPSLKSLILTGNPLSECKFPAGVVDAQGTRLVTYLKESKPDTEVKTVSLVNLIVLGNEGRFPLEQYKKELGFLSCHYCNYYRAQKLSN